MNKPQPLTADEKIINEVFPNYKEEDISKEELVERIEKMYNLYGEWLEHFKKQTKAVLAIKLIQNQNE